MILITSIFENDAALFYDSSVHIWDKIILMSYKEIRTGTCLEIDDSYTSIFGNDAALFYDSSVHIWDRTYDKIIMMSYKEIRTGTCLE